MRCRFAMRHGKEEVKTRFQAERETDEARQMRGGQKKEDCTRNAIEEMRFKATAVQGTD